MQILLKDMYERVEGDALHEFSTISIIQNLKMIAE